MLGVGWTEMLVIGVVALIVIGPKDLPMVMQRIGKFAGMVRRMGSEFQRELNKTTGLDEVRNLRDSITAPLKQTADEIMREFNTTSSTGAVNPTGAIAPKTPGAQSIVDEIHEAAGMKPPEASVQPVLAEPIKGAKLTPVPTSRVEAMELMALSAEGDKAAEKPKAKPRAKKAAAETAPAAPAKKTPAKKAAAEKAPAAPAKKAPAKKTVAPKEAAAPAPAKKAPASKSAAAKPAPAKAEAAPEPKPKTTAKKAPAKPKAEEAPQS